MILGIQYGDTGAYVELVQLALLRAGYTAIAVDGIFGAQTAAALASFQRVNGIEQKSEAKRS